MLTAVFLHGHLGEKYGAKLMLEVSCVAEAIGLLKANFSSFARDVVGHSYRVWVGKTNIDRDELMNPAKGQDIHIVPVVAGAGGASMDRVGLFGPKKSSTTGFWAGPHNFASDSKMGQVVRIIVGIVLVVVGFIFSEFGGIAWGVYPGLGLIFGGISDYITFSNIKKLGPQTIEPISSGRRAGYLFNGAVNTVGQGNPVPVLYGRMLVGSQVVSGAIEAGDL